MQKVEWNIGWSYLPEGWESCILIDDAIIYIQRKDLGPCLEVFKHLRTLKKKTHKIAKRLGIKLPTEPNIVDYGTNPPKTSKAVLGETK